MQFKSVTKLRNAAFMVQSLSLLSFFPSIITAVPQASEANCWKQLASVKNGPRQEHGVAAIGNHIYVIGGTKMSGETRGQDNSVEVYDVQTNTWVDGPPLPIEVHHPNVAAANGKVYVLGALAGFNPSRRTLGNVFRLDPAMNKWEELTPMPKGTERGASAVAAKGSTIYLAGGLQPQVGDRDYGTRVTDIVSAYDTASGNWTMLPKLPGKRDHVGGAFVGDTLYVVGGRLGSVQTVQSTTYALKSGAAAWDSLANMPTARGGIATAVLGTKIYTFGGEGNPALGTKQVFPQCESFDTVTGKWTKEPNMKQPRHGMQATVVGDLIYIPGGGLMGGGGEPVAVVESYKPGGC